MSCVHLTPEEYLARERRADLKSEYYRGDTRAVARATLNHSLIKDNIAGETGQQLKGGPCRVVTSDLRVLVDATGLYTYPDIVICCDKPEFLDDVFDTLMNPRVLVEVLSESTEKYDRGTKFGHYRQIPSLQEYLLVAQDRPHIERYVRQADNSWVMTEFAGLDAVLAFHSIPVSIPLAEAYRGVEMGEIPLR